LKTTTYGIKWVGCVSGGNGRKLGTYELGGGTEETILGFLVWVESRGGIEETKVYSTVWDDSYNRNSDSVVKGSDTSGGNGLLDTVGKTGELGLSSSYIRGKTGTGVIQWVDDAKGSGSSQTSRGHVDQKEFSKFFILIGFREHSLDGILEGKVEGLGREISNDIGSISTPEGLDSLLTGYTGETVDDTGVTLDLPGDDFRVGILGLDEELNTLNWCCACLGDSSGNTTGEEINHKV